MFARKSDLEHLERKLDICVDSLGKRLEVNKNAADVRCDRNQQEILLVREGINATQDILVDVIMALLDQPYIFAQVSKRIYDSKNNKKEE